MRSGHLLEKLRDDPGEIHKLGKAVAFFLPFPRQGYPVQGKFSEGRSFIPIRMHSESHTIRLKKQWFQDYETQVNVDKDDKTFIRADLSAAVKPKPEDYGRLIVTTTPQDAKVSLLFEGKDKKSDIELKAGRYIVEVSRKGYDDKRIGIDLKQGETRRVPVDLEEIPTHGDIAVFSIPSDASVKIDGKFVGKSPYEMKEMKSGTHLVQMQKEGYLDYETTIDVASGKRTVIEPALKAKDKGELIVLVAPRQSKIRFCYSDEKYTPNMKLKSGWYQIEASLDGYETERESVKVQPGRKNVLKITLNEVEKPVVTPTTGQTPSKTKATGRFVDNGDGTITDRKTGLMWQKAGIKEYLIYYDAVDYLKSLNRKKFAGYGDWRIPKKRELESLIDKSKPDGKKLPQEFDRSVKSCWTRSRHVHDQEVHQTQYYALDSTKGEFIPYAIRNLTEGMTTYIQMSLGKNQLRAVRTPK